MHVSVYVLVLQNCEWLIKTVIVCLTFNHYMDIHSNSRANTCVQTRLPEGLCLLDTEPTEVFLVPVDS